MSSKNSPIIQIFTKVDPDSTYKLIGENIIALRKSKGMTQQQVSVKLSVSPQQVQKYESGKSAMYAHTMIDIANIFGVSVNYLITKQEAANNIKFGKVKLGRDSGADFDDE